MTDYEKMYFQLAAKVADAVDILLKAQEQGEMEFMDGEPSLIKVIAFKGENGDSE
ncbi:hypothetical protein [Desulfitobacterium chlororespirans]|uniref:Uncharacterized protein n=1 Tax=Desulfitobacterium chlororespirans DSM 11544 TaxID=1121395 RepID=A0A1M7S4E1_9FIRM|nr:hypothetical protein [Desulfitobacterium chlororespirans]SHN53311.1 hypothetical protein SAMN02745215_00521 [Desulfitobacterium chlororespirans DSM 11544]